MTRKTLAVLFMILTLMMSAAPQRCLAAETVSLEGPADIRPGEAVTIAVSAPAGSDGVSADVRTEGLRFEGVSSAMCASYGLVLLPQMGVSRVEYTYTVLARAGQTAAFRLENLTVIRGAECSSASEQQWSLVLPEEASGSMPGPPEAADPPTSEAAPAAQEPSPTHPAEPSHLRVAGPENAYVSDTVQLVATLPSGGSASAEICSAGLTFVSVTSGLCSANRIELLGTPGLDAAVYTYRVTGPAGSTASFGVAGQPVCWERQITRPQIWARDPNMSMLAPWAGGSGSMQVAYDLADAGQSVTVDALRNLLSFPEAWTLEIRDGARQLRKTGSDLLATGDCLVFRNSEQNQVLCGELLLRGDLTGCGRLHVGQLTLLASSLNGAGHLSRLAAAAGDLNADGSLDINDLVRLAGALVRRTGAWP